MSVESALANRYALWHRVLCDDFGYEEVAPVRPPRSENELVIRAVRPPFEPVEAVAIDVRETWLPGDDPDLGLALHGCFLTISSWHAQVNIETGTAGAERLDVDRNKSPGVRIHRHPLGESNDVREPAAPLKHPDAWVQHLEEVIAQYYGY
jgi:hypothetical protein